MQLGGARVRPGTFRALAVSYFNSAVASNPNPKALPFPSLSPTRQTIYRNAIERALRSPWGAAMA